MMRLPSFLYIYDVREPGAPSHTGLGDPVRLVLLAGDDAVVGQGEGGEGRGGQGGY